MAVWQPEAEIAFVVGAQTKNVEEADAYDYVFGYVPFFDISARGLNRRTQFIPKGQDTYAVCGPWITTKDEVDDPHQLRVQSWVNEGPRQDYRTEHMAHKIPEQVAWLSRFIRLQPGDVVTTGTYHPGLGPLNDGDVLEIEIEKLGRARFFARGQGSPQGRRLHAGTDAGPERRRVHSGVARGRRGRRAARRYARRPSRRACHNMRLQGSAPGRGHSILRRRAMKVAVIILDMAKGYGWLPGSYGYEMVAHVKRLKDAAYAAGAQVLHVNSMRRATDGLPNPRMLPGTDAVDVIPELQPVDRDILIYKRYLSGFSHNDLDYTLRVMGIDTVVIAGASTDNTVLWTAADAHQFRYDVVCRRRLHDRASRRPSRRGRRRPRCTSWRAF